MDAQDCLNSCYIIMLMHISRFTDIWVLQPCLMGFVTRGMTFFLWGGCMMMLS
ncbi:hypothetical protein Hdeb2414_s0016g00478711 [Helianthus debilis subsp. tardiflorus]